MTLHTGLYPQTTPFESAPILWTSGSADRRRNLQHSRTFYTLPERTDSLDKRVGWSWRLDPLRETGDAAPDGSIDLWKMLWGLRTTTSQKCEAVPRRARI